MSFDWKCGVTNAVLTVLVYLLLLKVVGGGAGQAMANSAHWYEALETLLLVSAFIAFNVNGMVFSACKVPDGIKYTL